jgi:transposase
MGYLSENAKQSLVQKALEQKGKIKELAQQHHVGYSTLQKWIKHYRESVKISTKGQTTNKDLSSTEKFQHIVATATLDETSVGIYCRQHGIYSFQLQQWKEQFMTQKDDKKKKSELTELKLLRSENKALKQELMRKERALSETAALLVLKKKAALIWGESEDA